MALPNPLNAAKSVLWRIGFAMRESGQALERVGCRMQGIFSHEEPRKCRGCPRPLPCSETPPMMFICPQMKCSEPAHARGACQVRCTLRGL